jgi:RNA polymerase sigma-70 factor, ECF subfamily
MTRPEAFAQRVLPQPVSNFASLMLFSVFIFVSPFAPYRVFDRAGWLVSLRQAAALARTRQALFSSGGSRNGGPKKSSQKPGIFRPLACCAFRGTMPVTGRRGNAFSQIALEQIDNIYSYAVSLSRNPAQAEALVEATYRCAARAFGGLAPGSNLTSCLYAIARSIWLDQVRRDALVEASDEQAMPVEGNAGERVREALERLPRAYREVIVLREFEGLSYLDIASILHCPAGTVFSRLGRARARLRRIMDACGISAHHAQLEVNL